MKSNKSYWIVSASYSIGSKISTLLFGFGSFYFIIRGLEKSDFGVWALFLTITSIIEMSRNGLIQNALIKFLNSSEESEYDKVITASWILNLLYSLLIVFVLILLSSPLASLFHASEFIIMFRYYSIILLLLIPFSQFNYLQQYKFDFSGIFWSSFVRQATFFSIILACYIFKIEYDLVLLVFYQLISAIIGLLVAFWCARKYSKHNWVIDWKIVRSIFSFGKYVMGTNILSLAFKSTDQLFVGYFLNSTSVALYNSSIRVSNLIEYPATSIAEIVYPKSAQMYEKEKDLATKNYYEKGVGLTMTLTVPVVILSFLFAEQIISIIAGDAYIESSKILRITILFGLFTPFSRQFGAAMDSSGRPHINFTVLVISFLLNLITNFIGIKYFGLMGAAYGTLVSYGISGAICYLLMYKIFKVSLKNAIRSMFSYYTMVFHKIDWKKRSIT